MFLICLDSREGEPGIGVGDGRAPAGAVRLPGGAAARPHPDVAIRLHHGGGVSVVERENPLDVSPDRLPLPSGHVSYTYDKLIKITVYGPVSWVDPGDLKKTNYYVKTSLAIFFFSWIFYILTQLVALIYWIHVAIREWRGADENNNDEEEERAQVIIAEVSSVLNLDPVL